MSAERYTPERFMAWADKATQFSERDVMRRLAEAWDQDRQLIADLYEALLEALRELEGYDQDIGGEGYNNPRINAVLAKARGENPDE